MTDSEATIEATIQARANRALQKLAKWRALLAGWHLGSAVKLEPGVQAMRDLREAVLMHRAELSALVALLVEKKVFTVLEFTDANGREAAFLDAMMAQQFPGYHTTDAGITIHDPEAAAETCRRLGFPE